MYVPTVQCCTNFRIPQKYGKEFAMPQKYGDFSLQFLLNLHLDQKRGPATTRMAIWSRTIPKWHNNVYLSMVRARCALPWHLFTRNLHHCHQQRNYVMNTHFQGLCLSERNCDLSVWNMNSTLIGMHWTKNTLRRRIFWPSPTDSFVIEIDVRRRASPSFTRSYTTSFQK